MSLSKLRYRIPAWILAALFFALLCITPIKTHAAETDMYTFTTKNAQRIKVYYAMPDYISSDTKVLFVMHGVNRDADNYINTFGSLAEEENIVVIAPEFTKNAFSTSQYQYNNIGKSVDNPQNWTSKIIDEIYMDFTRRFNIPREKYVLYGHSAGAQFAHRALMYSESRYLDYVIAANAGSYTFPDINESYPYGIQDTLEHQDLINGNFSRKMYILTGDRDTQIDAYLSTSARANAQGYNRHERAINFYAMCETYCQASRIPFHWELVVMQDVSHSSSQTKSFVVDIINSNR